jgi:hypothetical protein
MRQSRFELHLLDTSRSQGIVVGTEHRRCIGLRLTRYLTNADSLPEKALDDARVSAANRHGGSSSHGECRNAPFC